MSPEAETPSSEERPSTPPAEEFAELKDKYLRLAAELENYKKRTAKEQTEFLRFANEQLLKELLPVLDNLGRALKSAQGASEEASRKIAEGVELIYKQFLGVLEKGGVRQMETVGQPFNPFYHQALSSIEPTGVPEDHVLGVETGAPESQNEPGGEPRVVQEVQKGYFLFERVLRPALVVVEKKRD